MSEEIRNAITAYLEGVSMEELRLLDEASKRAAADFADMHATLKATNAKLDKVFAQIDRMRMAASGRLIDSKPARKPRAPKRAA